MRRGIRGGHEKWIGIAAVAALVGTSAWAADIATKAAPVAVPAAFNWTGWYVGVNGGAAWRSKESTVTGFNIDDGDNLTTQTLNIDPEYNWQIAPQWVVGVEADIQGGSIRDSSTVTVLPGVSSPDGPVVASATNRLDWFGTVRVATLSSTAYSAM
jgi:outer membrane immunogenic protein